MRRYADETVPSWWENTHINLVGCLFSFTILNILENNRGLVKILVYSFVFDTYNQISVIFFAINIIITSG